MISFLKTIHKFNANESHITDPKRLKKEDQIYLEFLYFKSKIY
jgi:hypothetical protein